MVRSLRFISRQSCNSSEIGGKYVYCKMLSNGTVVLTVSTS